ncbi:hypothetical protein HN789_01815 [archaeon]|jgi:lysophospholipase L1-like esterase|nr:hypothetical protein [archaeon]MBT4022551.1 hypothetical protein [archaeon]MBT4272877.1 hypothetical protein [archaeon]MBT4461677.1 hypothetical protein [archaeon]MBT4857555.1 hypothetical protein [archaeon]
MIVVFGDSIAFGEFDNRGGWANRLKKDFKIINRSICGEDTIGLLKRIKIELEQLNPNKIIIALGINDSAKFLKKNRVSLTDFKKNYDLIIQLSKFYSKEIYCIGLTRVDEKKVCPIPWDNLIYYHNSEADKYDNAIEKIAKKHNLRYISMKKILLLSEMEDGLHPNSEGHIKMYKKMKKILKQNKK